MIWCWLLSFLFHPIHPLIHLSYTVIASRVQRPSLPSALLLTTEQALLCSVQAENSKNNVEACSRTSAAISKFESLRITTSTPTPIERLNSSQQCLPPDHPTALPTARTRVAMAHALPLHDLPLVRCLSSHVFNRTPLTQQSFLISKPIRQLGNLFAPLPLW